jgi:hypothetical protein
MLSLDERVASSSRLPLLARARKDDEPGDTGKHCVLTDAVVEYRCGHHNDYYTHIRCLHIHDRYALVLAAHARLCRWPHAHR